MVQSRILPVCLSAMTSVPGVEYFRPLITTVPYQDLLPMPTDNTPKQGSLINME